MYARTIVEGLPLELSLSKLSRVTSHLLIPGHLRHFTHRTNRWQLRGVLPEWLHLHTPAFTTALSWPLRRTTGRWKGE